MNNQELEEAVSRLRRQGTDDALVEAKACQSALSHDVWETVSAFANTAGGTILLGVSERDDFAPVRGFVIDKVLDQFISGMGDAGSGARVANPPRYSPERHELDGLPVLAIEIEPLEFELRPCYIIEKGIAAGSYKRVDDRDIRLSAAELYSMTNVMKPSTADAEAVDGTSIDDLDDSLVDALIGQASVMAPKAMRNARTTPTRLARLGALKSDGRATLAGLLTCGAYPQQHFPSAVVDVAVHAGVDKAMPGSPRFLDRVRCEGPLGEVVDDAARAVFRNLRIMSVVRGTGRVDIPEVPLEVLREAIANAVVHREYSPLFAGTPVQVDVYADRVEVISPGGLWGGKTIENLDDGQSRCRNASLMRLAALLPMAGDGGKVAEGGGTGVSMMLAEMAAARLPEPAFVERPDCFTVRFERGGLTNGEIWFSPRLEMPLPADVSPHRLTKAAVLALLSADEPLGVQDLSKMTGAKPAALRAHLRNLIADGEVVATAPANDKSRRYVRVK
ncbi:MAG: putative DNA binding domain-containing protein [Eggerthellaceae bacterium]|nr:putative DNA binding domain-containing protein [Eggerthellaceae bacterium]